jgi:formylglycine-generating enzyme required for sulfatase activity
MPSENPSSVLEYLDFDLEIGLGDGRTYPVVVLDSPSGEARGVMNWPYDEINLRLHLVQLENVLLRSATTRRVASSEDEQTVEKFGSNLFNALFDDSVRNRFEVSLERARMQGKGLRIKLRILAPELAALPWEFLYDLNRSEYLCFSRQTPIVRYPSLPISVQPLEITPPLRILGMVASPRDLASLDVRSEKERLSQPLKILQDAGLVELHWLEGQTWRDLQRAMRQGPWHVFHFIGHGGFDSQREEGFLALCDEEGNRFDLRATQLARLIADHSPLRLVVLNACEGGRSSQDDIFSSSASILLRGGVPAVLAMQYAITDRAAVEFARTFYEALADGIPVDTAVAEGRLAISLAFADTIEWGTPVLYLRAEDGVLFDVHKTNQPVRKIKEIKPEPLAELNPPARAADTQPAAPEPITRSLTLVERALRLEQKWWALGAFGLLGLCLLLMFSLSVLESPLAFWLQQPNTPIAVIEATATSPVSQALLEPSQTAAPEQVFTATVPPTTQPTTETPVPTQPEPSPTPTRIANIFPSDTPNPLASSVLQAGATQKSPRDEDKMIMVYIPEGEFQMGCDPENNAGFPCNWDERLHLLYLDAYWIDQTQVTNAMYKACVDDGDCEEPLTPRSFSRSSYYGNPEFDDFPVVFVSWDKADAYCKWAGKRLPTEAEWEKAARGPMDTRPYPWGSQPPTCEVANFNPGAACEESLTPTGYTDTTLSGKYTPGASPYGVLDMAGNVWDWVSDFYSGTYYDESPEINPTGPAEGLNKVVRGACWRNNAAQLRVSNRHYSTAHLNYDDIGFRCALSP